MNSEIINTDDAFTIAQITKELKLFAQLQEAQAIRMEQLRSLTGQLYNKGAYIPRARRITQEVNEICKLVEEDEGKERYPQIRDIMRRIIELAKANLDYHRTDQGIDGLEAYDAAIDYINKLYGKETKQELSESPFAWVKTLGLAAAGITLFAAGRCSKPDSHQGVLEKERTQVPAAEVQQR